MSLPGVIFVVLVAAFIAYVVYNAVKKEKSGRPIPGGGGVYPTPTPTLYHKPNEEVIPEPYVVEYSPETAVILPEPTNTPDVKKKAAPKKSTVKKDAKKSSGSK